MWFVSFLFLVNLIFTRIRWPRLAQRRLLQLQHLCSILLVLQSADRRKLSFTGVTCPLSYVNQFAHSPRRISSWRIASSTCKPYALDHTFPWAWVPGSFRRRVWPVFVILCDIGRLHTIHWFLFLLHFRNYLKVRPWSELMADLLFRIRESCRTVRVHRRRRR